LKGSFLPLSPLWLLPLSSEESSTLLATSGEQHANCFTTKLTSAGQRTESDEETNLGSTFPLSQDNEHQYASQSSEEEEEPPPPMQLQVPFPDLESGTFLVA